MDRLPENDAVLFDGAMGTYLAQKFGTGIRLCEYENLANPDHVLAVHREYIAAGADAIKTNTFSANTAASGARFEEVRQIIDSGCELARRAAAGGHTRVFASIGPIAGDDEADVRAEYRRIVEVFLIRGVTNFLFETFVEYQSLIDIARYIKSREKSSSVITECTVAPDHYTKNGFSAQEILNALAAVPEIDTCGFNCTCGPMHMHDLIRELDFRGKPACVMPNAGYPAVIGGRTVFNSQPDYFARQLAAIHDCGVQFIGGCCGTTPLHIAQTAALLRRARSGPTDTSSHEDRGRMSAPPQAPQTLQEARAFFMPEGSARTAKRIAVELDSPLDADTGFFTDAAGCITAAGADLITIADCPIGRARADSSLLAAKLRREYHIASMPHLTCRDRNLNATKALLLGLNAEGVNDVLVVTGDPIPSSDRGEIKSVFNFNSVRLAAFINDLNGTVFSACRFRISAALNVNAPGFAAELEKAQRKQAAGVTVFLTQPILTEAAVDNLRLARRRLTAAVLGGILPIVSYKNACFINNEVSGITIPEELVARYEHATPAQAQRLAVETSLEIASKIAGDVDGFYIITPMKKVETVCEIVAAVREKYI
ncbi:MAG: bifunctional homocysteine S-methyltransferase/methylenetetrahydrofolate reductase [Clostridia bacterium]|nr:bifunctional homocysteine S-methyltransferase/methylenetetrahydrofolate reductase [Clostridia bacterium]